MPDMSYQQRGGICFQYSKSGTCSYGSGCKFVHERSNGSRGSGASVRKSKRSKQRSKANRRRQSVSVNHIDEYFGQYPDFDYDSSAPIWTEFYRMHDLFEWEKDSDELREAKGDFKAAMVKQFDSLYGRDENDLTSWQNLCHILNIQPVPDELEKCRKRVRRTHVNLVDLVDSPRTGSPVKVFPTLEGLQNYTISTGKIFPKKNAQAGGLLKFLLREIFQ